MAKQKTDPKQQTTPADPVEVKVDAMMAVKDAKAADAKPIADVKPTEKPLDIFSGEPAPLQTAPLLPHARRVATTPEPAQPSAPLQAKPELTIEPPKSKLSSDDITVEPLNIDTPQTDAAIQDIVAQEADEVLAAQDAGIEAAANAAEETPAIQPKRRGHPIFWFMIFVLVLLVTAVIVFLTSPGLSPSFAP